MSTAKAKTINLLLYDGNLEGVICIEDSSWNAGELYSTPRESVEEQLKTDAVKKYGVYLLLSKDKVYVGQSSDLSKRITYHTVGKDWWETVVILTTSDNRLNHSDIDYLEAKLIEKLADGCVEGAPTRVTFCERDKSAVGQLDKLITKLREDGYRDIVILTCGTEETSIFFEHISNGKYKNKTKFTTCRKYKGLEADVIILVDVKKDTFCDDNVLLFYVGASRARIQLDILTTMTESDCVDVLKNNLHVEGKIRKGRRDLAKALKARALLEEQ